MLSVYVMFRLDSVEPSAVLKTERQSKWQESGRALQWWAWQKNQSEASESYRPAICGGKKKRLALVPSQRTRKLRQAAKIELLNADWMPINKTRKVLKSRFLATTIHGSRCTTRTFLVPVWLGALPRHVSTLPTAKPLLASLSVHPTALKCFVVARLMTAHWSWSLSERLVFLILSLLQMSFRIGAETHSLSLGSVGMKAFSHLTMLPFQRNVSPCSMSRRGRFSANVPLMTTWPGCSRRRWTWCYHWTWL